MHTLPLLALALIALAPLAAAQADPTSELAPPDAPATPAWQETLQSASDGIAAGSAAATGAAASALEGAAGLAQGAGQLAVAAAQAIGAGIAFVLSLLGSGLTAIGQGALHLFALMGAGLAAATHALLAALGAGAGATWQFARANPREAAAIAGSASVLGTLAWLVKRFGLLALLPLYTRLAPSQMLDNEHRAAVYEHVKQHPGAHPSAIAETLGMGWGTIVYHLARLEEAKLVTVKPSAHRKCYFAVGSQYDAEERNAVAAMATDKARAVVQTVRSQPGITQKDLAAHLGMSQALASWHIKRLVANGVLLTTRHGRSNTLRVAEHVPIMAPAAPPIAALSA